MSRGRSGSLDEIDAALIAIRRWADRPPARIQTTAGSIELSTVLVVDAIARSGRGTSVAAVASALDVAPSTASRLVDRAVSMGMVKRSAADDDPRRASLRLTPEGTDLQREAVAFRTGSLRTALHQWSSSEVACFAQLLTRFAADAAAGPHRA